MTRVLVDTAVFLYAQGREHPYRDPCAAIVELIAEHRLSVEASVELLQEYAHFRLRRGADPTEVRRDAARIADICELHDFERPDALLMLQLLVDHRVLDVRDAAFAATALNRGIDAIVSPDGDYDGVPGLERIDPADTARIDGLA